MSKTELIISGQGQQRKITLIPKGMTIGRGENCDIVLDHKMVSRLHARIFQDPFGRWIIEDMDSNNGVFVDDQKIKAQAVSSNQKIFIGSFLLLILEAAEQELRSGTSVRSALTMLDGEAHEDIVSFKDDEVPILSPDLMQHLNEFTAGLLELRSPSGLYSEACLRLSQMLNTLVAIVRLPGKSQPMPEAPDILACHFGGSETETNLTLSRRVLDAVRTEDKPVMASSWPASSGDVGLTIIDSQRPHLVFGARVNDTGENIDVLYFDILELKSPKEMFFFSEAAARQIDFMQKNLFYIELQKKEQALREANEQLKEKDRIKDEYVSRVTHDIKGHLAAIQSCLFVASSEKSGTLTEKQSDFLKRAVTRNEKLTAFVRELLNLTQMRLSGQIETKEFSLTDSIAGALETVGRKAEDKSITLSSKIAEAVGSMTGDEFSINEMITNLLFNAIKYTPEGKTVHLEATVQDNSVRLDFTDTGIGIPEGEAAHVFDEFFRATNAKKSANEGTGLGLSIVKQIVERHGGNISVKSSEGEGSTFTVIIPVS
jgi:signal transduction histidine kinase